MKMYLPKMVLSLSLLTAFNVLGAQNDNFPTPDLTTPASVSVPYRSSFSSYKPYAEEELSSWRDLNPQVTVGGLVDHSMGNMKGMDHEKMKSMPSGQSMPKMKGMQHDYMKPTVPETSRPPEQGMDHESMKDIPLPTFQPLVKGISHGPHREILLAMNDQEMASKHASQPAIENIPHEHNETKSSAPLIAPMAAWIMVL
jgi:hypothetical protein